jgi:hypothetical protein
MSAIEYRDLQISAEGLSLRVRLVLENRSGRTWSSETWSL